MTLGAAAQAHLKAVRTAFRAVPDVPAGPGALVVDLERVAAYRAGATRLDRRLPEGSHGQVAYGGLQDSAPRSALLALHARLEGVRPVSWEHAALVQTWFRWADYVVPRADFAVFTLGVLPRDPEPAAALAAVGEAVSALLGGGALPARAVHAALPEAQRRRGHDPGTAGALLLRGASATGRFRIRWDARTVTLLPVEPPGMDLEEAPLELARRFLGWHGPASAAQFAMWAGVTRRDAAETWARLRPELIAGGVVRDRVLGEAESLAGPLGRPVRVRWLRRPRAPVPGSGPMSWR